MKAIDFPESNLMVAKGQDQYQTIPAWAGGGHDGRMAFLWKLTWRERLVLLLTGRLWQQSNGPLQPQLLTVDKPDLMVQPEH